MWPYYSPLGRRKSTATSPNLASTNSPPTSPQAPSYPYSSTLNEASVPRSPRSSPSSPRLARSPSRRKSILGSPFSTRRRTAPGPDPDPEALHGGEAGILPLPPSVLSEEDRDTVLASGGSTAPLVKKDFALEYPDSASVSASARGGKGSKNRSFPRSTGNGITNGASDSTKDREREREEERSDEAFFPLYEDIMTDLTSPISPTSPTSPTDPTSPTSHQVSLSPPASASNAASGSDILANRTFSQPPVRRTAAATAAQASDPPSIPPASAHDTYVSNFIQPLAPPSLEQRPGIVRASTAPGLPGLSPLAPTTTATAQAQASAQASASVPDNNNAPSLSVDKNKGDRPQPLFEIFNAQLSPEAENLSMRLRNHLEDVLRGQEMVGRMHMGLEKAVVDQAGKDRNRDRKVDEEEKGKDEDKEKEKEREREALLRREKGVEDIMQRLEDISNTLRTYHNLGTPRLAFHQPVSVAAKEKLGKSKTISVGTLDLNAIRRPDDRHLHGHQHHPHGPWHRAGGSEPETETGIAMHKQKQKYEHEHEQREPRTPTNTNPGPNPNLNGNANANGEGQDKARSKPRSPLSNTFHPSSSTSTSVSIADDNAQHATRSALPPSPLPLDSPPKGFRGDARRRSWDVQAQDQRVNDSPPRWFDSPESPESRRAAPASSGAGAGAGKRERTITDSPIGMVDSSRF